MSITENGLAYVGTRVGKADQEHRHADRLRGWAQVSSLSRAPLGSARRDCRFERTLLKPLRVRR